MMITWEYVVASLAAVVGFAWCGRTVNKWIRRLHQGSEEARRKRGLV